jgi:hypothetical protein
VNGPGNLPFLIFGIDTNYYAKPTLALGRVSDDQLLTLSDKFNALRQSILCDGITLSAGEFERCIRILILHHSPIRQSNFSYFTMLLEQRKKLLRTIKGNIDVILYGHFHRGKVNPVEGMAVIQGNSTTQYEPKDRKNGFNIINFWRNDKKILLTNIQYTWVKNRFEQDRINHHLIKRP